MWMYANCGMAMSEARYDPEFYVRALDRYVESGECDVTDSEPLYAYLLSVMNDPLIKVQVLSDEVCARVFYDNMIQFVQLNLDKEKYHLQKSQSEQRSMKLVPEWSVAKRKDGWQALLQEVSEKYKDYGFPSRFYQAQFGQEERYADDEVWEKMVDDWEEAFRRKTAHEKKKEVDLRKEAHERRLRSNMKEVPEYVRKHQVEKDEFYQTWGLMSGLWNSVDFERIRQVVRMQRSYPEIVKVARKMGRIADDEGKERMNVSVGEDQQLEHSSKCDIQGITVGNDLNALLPVELAHCADDDLEDLFVYKYLTRKLQTFQYKSEVTQPARRLHKKPARRKGPMIVCLDTSGSMAGKPEKIAHSLLMKLLEIADRQRRDCFLIAFSVSIHPIDIRKERARLLEFFSRTACGDTDATRMLEATLKLLRSSVAYVNADVLWVSDFKIPLVSEVLGLQIQQCREENTRFYGLQIGIAENEWAPFFDRIYRIGYTPSRYY